MTRRPARQPEPDPPSSEWFTYSCGRPRCGAFIQGGQAGLDAHLRVVHGEGRQPDPDRPSPGGYDDGQRQAAAS